MPASALYGCSRTVPVTMDSVAVLRSATQCPKGTLDDLNSSGDSSFVVRLPHTTYDKSANLISRSTLPAHIFKKT